MKDRLTDDGDVTDACLGDGRVNLAHVAAVVRFLDVVNMQIPCVVLVVGHTDAGIARDHAILHRQNGRPFQMDPCHLIHSLIH